MSILQHTIEKKLSAAIGAKVAFEKFKMSLLGGSVEASGVTIAGDFPAAPLLAIRRIRAEISVAKALAKQIVIKSLTIEGPVLSIVHRQDGSTNLPRRRPAVSIAPPQNQPEEESAAWGLETQKVSLTDGRIIFRDEFNASAYHASLDQISAELIQDEDQVTVTLNAPSVGRRDRQVSLGSAHLKGHFSEVTDLTKLAQAPLEAKLEITGGMTVSVTSPKISGKDISVEVQGPLDLVEWAAVVPPSVPLPSALSSPGFSGKGNLSLKLHYDFSTLRVREFVFRASEVTVPL